MLIAGVLEDDMLTVRLPAGVGILLPTDPTERFRSELSVGASYTTKRKVTFNLEFWLNQTGFTQSDWNHWFALAGKRTASSQLRAPFCFIPSSPHDQV